MHRRIGIISGMRRVIKFGGTSIATPALVRDAAAEIMRLVQGGGQVAVVVSAPGSATGELLEAAAGAGGGEAGFRETCELAALGEERSVRLMCIALRSLGIPVMPFLPHRVETWPIIAACADDSPLATAKVNEERDFALQEEQTARKFDRHVMPLLRSGAVPVIAGFFAVDDSERIVSLGRGGSDITAFIVASHVRADEVVIVSDVKGVLSADPRLADDPRLLTELSTDDMQVIAACGARVLHPRALKHRREGQCVRLVDYRELGRLEESGTSVLGRSSAELIRNPVELGMLTIVGDPDELRMLHDILPHWRSKSGLQPAATNLSHRYICYYLPAAESKTAYRELFNLLRRESFDLVNLAVRENVGEITLRSTKFINQPGVLTEITGVLSNARINIIEIITGLTDISVYINYTDMDAAEGLLRTVMGQFVE